MKLNDVFVVNAFLDAICAPKTRVTPKIRKVLAGKSLYMRLGSPERPWQICTVEDYVEWRHTLRHAAAHGYWSVEGAVLMTDAGSELCPKGAM